MNRLLRKIRQLEIAMVWAPYYRRYWEYRTTILRNNMLYKCSPINVPGWSITNVLEYEEWLIKEHPGVDIPYIRRSEKRRIEKGGS